MNTNAWIHYGLAQITSFFRRYEVAIEEYRQSIAHDPDNARSWRCMGFLQAQNGQAAAGIDSLREALRIAPEDSNTRFNLAFVLHQSERIEEAIAEFEQVVAANPNNDRGWYGMGLCLEQRGDLEGALKALKEAARIQYFNPHAGHRLALLYHKLGRKEDLLAEYERVNDFDPKFGEQIRRETGITPG